MNLEFIQDYIGIGVDVCVGVGFAVCIGVVLG